MEKRTMSATATTFQTREAENDLYIEGYFSVFNSPYEICDGIREYIAPGSFDGIEGKDIRALCNHDTRLVLGRTKAGTLALRQDDHGLFGTIRINRDDVDAMNLYHRVERGDVDQCSFGFFITDEERKVQPDNSVEYWIRKVDLHEVSVVTFPAYEATGVSARMAQEETIKNRRLNERREEIRKMLKGEPDNGN